MTTIPLTMPFFQQSVVKKYLNDINKETLQELSKQKIKLKLSQQSEWMNYFEEQKTKAIALQKLIDYTDKGNRCNDVYAVWINQRRNKNSRGQRLIIPASAGKKELSFVII